MNDTPLVSLLTSAQLQGVRSGTASTSATAVPPAIARLPTGTILKGRVMGKDGHGNPILRTEQGDLPLHTDFKLRSGSEIVIRLESSSAGLRARILSIDGLSPKLAAKQQPQTGDTVKTSLEVSSSSPQAQTLPAKGESGEAPRAPIRDALHLSLPKEEVFRAILLSRSPEFPDVIRQLPQSVEVSAQRLASGAQVSFRIVASNIPLQQPAVGGGVGSAVVNADSATKTATTTGAATTTTTATTATTTTTTTAPAGATTANTAAATGSVTTATTTATTATTATTQDSGIGSTTTEKPSSATATTAGNDKAAPAVITRSYIPANPYAAYAKSSKAYQSSATVTATGVVKAGDTGGASGGGISSSSQATSSLASGQISAQVVGTEKSGDIVLNTTLGTLKLPAATLPVETRLPGGTQLTLELISLRPATSTVSASSSSALSSGAGAVAGDSLQTLPPTAEASTLSTLSGKWVALEELITTLHQLSPTDAAQFIRDAVPNTGTKLTSTMIFFIAALRGGDVQQWLGKRNVELLEQHQRGDILRSLAADFQILRNAFMESSSPNWQALFFPVIHDKELQQARLFIKKDGKNNSASPDPKRGMRFIVEVELSELGDMQLDGFVKKRDKDTLFDLIVRTLKPLIDEHRKEILRIFGNAAEITGFKGQLQFSHDDHFPVVPLDEILEHNSDIVA